MLLAAGAIRSMRCNVILVRLWAFILLSARLHDAVLTFRPTADVPAHAWRRSTPRRLVDTPPWRTRTAAALRRGRPSPADRCREKNRPHRLDPAVCQDCRCPQRLHVPLPDLKTRGKD